MNFFKFFSRSNLLLFDCISLLLSLFRCHQLLLPIYPGLFIILLLIDIRIHAHLSSLFLLLLNSLLNFLFLFQLFFLLPDLIFYLLL